MRAGLLAAPLKSTAQSSLPPRRRDDRRLRAAGQGRVGAAALGDLVERGLQRLGVRLACVGRSGDRVDRSAVAGHGLGDELRHDAACDLRRLRPVHVQAGEPYARDLAAFDADPHLDVAQTARQRLIGADRARAGSDARGGAHLHRGGQGRGVAAGGPIAQHRAEADGGGDDRHRWDHRRLPHGPHISSLLNAGRSRRAAVVSHRLWSR